MFCPQQFHFISFFYFSFFYYSSFLYLFFFFFSSRRRHTRSLCDWSSDVCSSDLQSIARRRLCHLHSLQPTMPAQDHLQLRSRLQNSFQRAPNHSEAIAGDLDYFTHRTSAQANCQSSSNIALAPHYAHFHRSAVLGHQQLRKHFSVWHI